MEYYIKFDDLGKKITTNTQLVIDEIKDDDTFEAAMKEMKADFKLLLEVKSKIDKTNHELDGKSMQTIIWLHARTKKNINKCFIFGMAVMCKFYGYSIKNDERWIYADLLNVSEKESVLSLRKKFVESYKDYKNQDLVDRSYNFFEVAEKDFSSKEAYALFVNDKVQDIKNYSSDLIEVWGYFNSYRNRNVCSRWQNELKREIRTKYESNEECVKYAKQLTIEQFIDELKIKYNLASLQYS